MSAAALTLAPQPLQQGMGMGLLKLVATIAGLWREHHDELARFMAAISPQGAAEAAHLSGLTLTMETHIEMHIGQLRLVSAAEEGPSMPEE